MKVMTKFFLIFLILVLGTESRSLRERVQHQLQLKTHLTRDCTFTGGTALNPRTGSLDWGQQLCVKQSSFGHKEGVLFVQLGSTGFVILKPLFDARTTVAMELAKKWSIGQPDFKIISVDDGAFTAIKNAFDAAKFVGGTESRESKFIDGNGLKEYAIENSDRLILLMEPVVGQTLAEYGKVAKYCMTKFPKNGRVFQFPEAESDDWNQCGGQSAAAITDERAQYKNVLSSTGLDTLATIGAFETVLMELDGMTYPGESFTKGKVGNLENIMVKTSDKAPVVIDIAVSSWGDLKDVGGSIKKDTDQVKDKLKTEVFDAAGLKPRLDKRLRYPGLSTEEFKEQAYVDTFVLFPSMPALTIAQYNTFAQKYVDGLKLFSKTKVGEITEVITAIKSTFVGESLTEDEVGNAKKKLGEDLEKLKTFLVARAGDISGVGDEKTWTSNVLSAEDNFGNFLGSEKIKVALIQYPPNPIIRLPVPQYQKLSTIVNKVLDASRKGIEQKQGAMMNQLGGIFSKGAMGSALLKSAVKPSVAPSDNPDALHGYLAVVDLTKLNAQVSDKTVMDTSSVCPEEVDTEQLWKFKQFTTSEFLNAVATSNLAVNANFFMNANDVHNKKCARPYGLCMHDGTIENAATVLGDEDPQDALRQRFELNAKGTVDLIIDNESGKAQIVTDFTADRYPKFKEGVAGNWLVKEGDTLNALILNPVPIDREARMAVGYKNSAPNIIYILGIEKKAVDRSSVGETTGLKPAESIKDLAPKQVASSGISLMEMAEIMKGIGLDNAVNLDGGGSSGLCVHIDAIKYCMVPSDFFQSEVTGRVFKERPSPCQMAFIPKD